MMMNAKAANSHLGTITRTLRLSAARIVSSEEGGVATTLGLSLIPLLLALGLAVDGGLAYGTQNKLQGAVDAAALASARAASSEDGDVEADARMFFEANFPDDYLGGRLTDFDARFNEETGEVTVEAQVDMPTSFMSLAGINNVPVSVSSTAQQQLSGLELAMVLDTTGSMGFADPAGGTKIDALKDASETLLTAIYGENETVDEVSVSVVPYTTAVNIGTSRTDFLTGFDPSAFGTAGWQGCVETRGGSRDRDDTPPSVESFTAYQFPGADPNFLCTENEILPLTDERSIVSGHIDSLIAFGGTINNLGLSWGWRTISPRWRGVWGSSEEPVDYDHPTIKKAVIFMTDGETALDFVDYSAYGELSEQRLGTTNEDGAEDEIDSRMLESCDLAKQEGIEIYTIMFALDNAQVEQNFRACASSNEHFFDAPDGDALNAAFENIAGQLTSLRLTQ